jgi:hypothetical protein
VRTAADDSGVNVAGGRLLPVIVWFHGGSYGEGSAAGALTRWETKHIPCSCWLSWLFGRSLLLQYGPG